MLRSNYKWLGGLVKVVMPVLVLLSPFHCIAQSSWHPYGGIHLSMDAGAYFLGPSLQIGTDYTYTTYYYKLHENYPYKRQYFFTAYLHCFLDKNAVKSDNAPVVNGKYSSFTIALLVQTHLSKNEHQGWFVAGGMALQRTSAEHQFTFYDDRLKRIIATAAMRTGYKFAAKKNEIAIEINATGPHFSTEKNPPYNDTQVLEVLTQLSLGARFIL